MKRSVLILGALAVIVSCSDSGDQTPNHADASASDAQLSDVDAGGDIEVGPAEVQVSYDFSDGAQGWSAKISDYPVGTKEAVNFIHGVQPLPSSAMADDDKAYYLQADSQSADVFMYIVHKVGPDDGIEADTTYRANFTADFWTNYPKDCAAKEGELMYLKMGGTTYEPATIKNDDGDRFELNVRKGNGKLGGDAASFAGNLTHDEPCQMVYERYIEQSRPHTHTALIESSSDGGLWLLMGVDSEYAGEMSMYITSLEVKLTPEAE